MERKKGCYWVKFRGEWTVGHYAAGCAWQIIGSEETFTDKDFELIGVERLHWAVKQ